MTDATAVITGAGSGIGKAMALGLADLVDRFVLVGRDLGKLERVGEALGLLGKHVQLLPRDLSSGQEVADLASLIRGHCERLDLLIHCAGVIRTGTVEDAGAENLDWHYAVNLRAPVMLTQMCLPLLRTARGQIVFVNSSAALTPKSALSGYCASKAALKAFADSLRAEENANDVRVLSVYPGRTATPMQEALYVEAGKPYVAETLLQSEDVAEAVVGALRLPRTAEVTDLMIRGMHKA